MKKIIKGLLNLFKNICYTLITIFVILSIVVIGFEIAINVTDEPLSTKIFLTEMRIYNWCYYAYEDVSQWCEDAVDDATRWGSDVLTNAGKWWNETIENAKAFLNNDNNDEELSVDGAKLNDISSYEIGKYINFTIPYTWTVGEVDVEEAATEESILLKGKSIVMTISLKSVEGPKNFEDLKWTREAMIFDLQNKYSDYTFQNAEIIDEKAAVIRVTIPGVETQMYIAIISANEKTIIVTYTFSKEDVVEAELYFTIALSEMVESME